MKRLVILAISFALISGIVPLGVAAESPSTPAETRARPEKVETVQPLKDRPDEGVPVPRGQGTLK